jgi:hypothetical protein
VRKDLALLPSLYAESEALLVTAPRALGERVSGGRVGDLALNETILAVRSDIVAVLAAWAGLVVNEGAVPGPAARTADALPEFLSAHLDWLLAHTAAADFVEELTDLMKAARRAVRTDPDALQHLGPCARSGCASSMYAVTHRQGSPTGHVRCDSGHEWQPHQWLLLAQRIGRAQRAN